MGRTRAEETVLDAARAYKRLQTANRVATSDGLDSARASQLAQRRLDDEASAAGDLLKQAAMALPDEEPDRSITDAELTLVAAAHAYKRAAAAYAAANKGVDNPLLIPSAREKGAARRRLTAAATQLPDDPQAPRKKRVGDVWENENVRGVHYRIVRFDVRERAVIAPEDRTAAALAGMTSGDLLMGGGPDGSTHGWTLVAPGTGEEEP
jgi:hypothetical protein